METEITVLKLNRLTAHCFYSDSDPDTDRPSLGYILSDDGRAVMVDTGNSQAHFEEFMRELDREDLPRPSRVILTHRHWDHVLGMSACRVPVVACERTQVHLSLMSSWNEDGKKAFYDGNEYVRAEYPSPDGIIFRKADVTFSDRLTVSLGDVEIRAIHVTGPHSDDSVLIQVLPDGMIFAGDSSAGDFSKPGIPYDPLLLEEYTNCLLSLDFSCFLHSHRQPLDRKGTEEFLRRAKKRGYYIF